jgi:deazaflavin-dependent oxidoreductase (nitroreductase family)
VQNIVTLAAVDLFLKLVDRVWPLTRRLMAVHTAVYRASGGRIGHRLPGIPSMLLLEHVGARSGTRRISPLLYFRDGDNLVIVASKGGYPRHPAWLHNLRANPETVAQVGSERREVRARVADPDERTRLWPQALRLYPSYQTYQRRSGREIPVVILEPAREATNSSKETS